jgi:Flp pilus assembly pilin Flp
MKLFTLVQLARWEAGSSLRDEDGQTMAEYGVVLALVTLACLAAFTLLSTHIRGGLTSVANLLPG